MVHPCTLELILDNAPPGVELPTFRAGDTIQGRVRVRATQPVQGATLTLQQFWIAIFHNRGWRESVGGEPITSQPLWQGSLAPGIYDLPFSMVCAAVPLGYQGSFATIERRLDARLDYRGQLQVMPPVVLAHVPFLVQNPAGVTTFVEPVEDHFDAHELDSQIRRVVTRLVGGALLPAALASLFFAELVEMGSAMRALLLALAIWTVGMILWAGSSLRRLQRERRVRRFVATVNRPARDRLVVEYEVHTRRKLEEVRVRLAMVETVRYLDIRSHPSTWETHPTTRYAQVSVQPGEGQTARARVEFPLPDIAQVGWSFHASGLRLSWFVEFEVRLAVPLRPSLCWDRVIGLSFRPVLPASSSAIRGHGSPGQPGS